MRTGKRPLLRPKVRKLQTINKKKTLKNTKRYIKQSNLGQGAFGLVYSAFDQETSKIVAVKCLTNKESIESFKDELELLKKLHHPAIVPYIDSFTDSKGGLQIVMEYAEGGSLLDIIHKYGTLNEHLAAIYISQILKALVYLHEQKVIHRDIKAGNVLFHSGIAKLADFGLAVELNDGRSSILNECAGSPYWMAPEVIRGDSVNQKCDIWSVGSTVVELLEGVPPLFEKKPNTAMLYIAGDGPIPIPYDISDACRDFILLCFQRDPKKRPEASELLKHPWIQSVLSFMQKDEIQTHDYKNLSLKVETIPKNSGFLSISSFQKSPEEIILSLNNEKEYLPLLVTTINLIRTKKKIPDLIVNLCGIRMIIDRLEKDEFRIPTLNLIQLLVEQSEKVSTSLIEHCIIEDFFKSNNTFLQLIALLIILHSPKGIYLFSANRLWKNINIFYNNPLLTIFFPTFLNNFLAATLPKELLSSIFTDELISFVINTTFKAIYRINDYKNLLNNSFKNLNQIRTLEDLKEPHISSFFFEKSETFIEDSLSANLKMLSISNLIQLKYTKFLNPLIYIIKNLSSFPNLKTFHIIHLINILDVLFSDCLCKDNINGLQFIEQIMIFAISNVEELCSSSLRCLTRMIKAQPGLFEKAVDCGLCSMLMDCISRNIALSFAYELLCLTPTISSFTAYKSQETGIFEILRSLLKKSDWDERAIHSLAIWSQFNPSYIERKLSETNTYTIIYNKILDMIDMAYSSIIKVNFFNDIKILIHNKYISIELFDYDLLTRLVEIIQNLNSNNQTIFLEIINEFIINSQDPPKIAKYLLKYFAGLTESENASLQRAALHLRVLSRT